MHTRLRLREGESNLLAGLLRDEQRKVLTGLPGVMRVPGLRSLFGSTDEETQQTDIVMLLTPHIVRTHELTVNDLAPIYMGTQQNLGLGGPPPLIQAPPVEELARGTDAGPAGADHDADAAVPSAAARDADTAWRGAAARCRTAGRRSANGDCSARRRVAPYRRRRRAIRQRRPRRRLRHAAGRCGAGQRHGAAGVPGGWWAVHRAASLSPTRRGCRPLL